MSYTHVLKVRFFLSGLFFYLNIIIYICTYMGYRNYIGKISKENHNKIKDLTSKEFCEIYNTEYVCCRKIEGFECLYNLGKHIEDDIVDVFKTKFFNNIPEDPEEEFYIVSEQFLTHLINEYRKKTILYLKSLVESKDKDVNDINDRNKTTYKEYVENKISNWKREDSIINLDKSKNDIVNSWSYEHSIFELVRIYKSIDFEKDLLIYYGY